MHRSDGCIYQGDVPLAVRDDLDAVLEPLDLGVVLLHVDLELALVVLHAVHGLEFARELVLHVCRQSGNHEDSAGFTRVKSHLLTYVNSCVYGCSYPQC